MKIVSLSWGCTRECALKIISWKGFQNQRLLILPMALPVLLIPGKRINSWIWPQMNFSRVPDQTTGAGVWIQCKLRRLDTLLVCVCMYIYLSWSPSGKLLIMSISLLLLLVWLVWVLVLLILEMNLLSLFFLTKKIVRKELSCTSAGMSLTCFVLSRNLELGNLLIRYCYPLQDRISRWYFLHWRVHVKDPDPNPNLVWWS